MADELVKKENKPDIKSLFTVGGRRGLAGARAQAKEEMKNIDPLTVPNRLGLIFDDSDSMAGRAIDDAKKAVHSFTLSCNKKETSIAIYPLNSDKQILTIDYNLLNFYVNSINCNGGTPMYATITKMLSDTASPITRGVIFSDGEPTDDYEYRWAYDDNQKGKNNEAIAINMAVEKKIPLDTIYIGKSESDKGYKKMKWIAEQTGGIFIWFKDSLSLQSGLKYLSPGLRAMLMNPEIKQKIERGEKI